MNKFDNLCNLLKNFEKIKYCLTCAFRYSPSWGVYCQMKNNYITSVYILIHFNRKLLRDEWCGVHEEELFRKYVLSFLLKL